MAYTATNLPCFARCKVELYMALKDKCLIK